MSWWGRLIKVKKSARKNCKGEELSAYLGKGCALGSGVRQWREFMDMDSQITCLRGRTWHGCMGTGLSLWNVPQDCFPIRAVMLTILD